MSTDTTVSPLRQRMIEDMAARKLGPHAQRSHIHAAGASPRSWGARPTRRQPTIPGFQLHLVESRPEHPQSQPDHDGA